MPVWVKLTITFAFLNVLILGTGIYSINKLSQMVESVDVAIQKIDGINQSVHKASSDVETVGKNIGAVQESIAETSILAQDIYNKPLQSINFARTAQNDFINLDFMLFKASSRAALAESAKDIEDQFVLFKENFVIAEERAISPTSKDTIKVIHELVAKWEKIKVHILQGTASYKVIEPISTEIQSALAELVEFEAGAGYDFVLEAEKLTEKAKSVSENMAHSVESVVVSANAIAAASAEAQQTIMASKENVQNIRSVSKILNIIVFFASVSVVLFLAYDIVRPIRAAQVIATNITKGKLDNKIECRRRDEFGRLLSAMNQMQGDLKINMEIESKAKKDAQDMALASQSRQMRVSQSSDKLSTEVNRIMTVSRGALENLQNVANSLSSTASNSKDSSEHVMADISEITDAITTIATAVEEMSASIRDISSQTRHSSDTAQEAVKQASDAKEAVESLSEMSNKVGDIVQMINDIAEQTNLLALNATIESARAGEAGKGFAVVANEVKSLALETASATEQISKQIQSIQVISGQCVQAIQAIIETIDKIKETSLSIDGCMGDQGSATAEISSQTQRTSARMKHFVSNINTMASGVGVVHQSSADVLNSIAFIKDEMEVMDHNIKTITDEIRKAS